MNRNYKRVLTPEQIKDITERLAQDLVKYSNESSNLLVDHYLRGDVDGLFKTITNWVESAEDDVRVIMNSQLIEDSFKQSEDENI